MSEKTEGYISRIFWFVVDDGDEAQEENAQSLFVILCGLLIPWFLTAQCMLVMLNANDRIQHFIIPIGFPVFHINIVLNIKTKLKLWIKRRKTHLELHRHNASSRRKRSWAKVELNKDKCQVERTHSVIMWNDKIARFNSTWPTLHIN